MQQLVIRDGLVVATHPMEVFLGAKYPGCEVITWDKSISLCGEDGMPSPDPRTQEEKQNSYADNRRAAYPTIGEQLDMMYHDKVNGTTIWTETIQEIRDRHPKPAKVGNAI